MPVDYSKWDALELSDDSDIEVHPNVDKRSFIRAKQTQIHQQRIDRKHRITTLGYERIINDGLLLRIDALLKALDRHRVDIEGRNDADSVDEVVFDALMEITEDGSLGPDMPPAPPKGVHAGQEQPSYSKMMGALVDQVKSEVNKSKKEGKERYAAFIDEVGSHHAKVQELQVNLNKEVLRLEKEEGGKITSEGIRDGFNSSHIPKAAPVPAAAAAAAKSTKTELLNKPTIGAGSEADIEDGVVEGETDEEMNASPTAKRFGKIAYGDYKASLQFIGQHPEILAEKETDGLLVEAFNAQTAAKSKKDEDYARQCVHQALLLQYCRQLGKDGVGLFFQRVQTPNHQARKLFLDDVNSTYARIRSRTAELNKEAAENDNGEKELIQLHAVDPNTTINIQTPPPLDKCETEDETESRKIFEAFPPGLQRALQSGSLEQVNKILAKMSVEEAEIVVEQLGNGGMLSLEQGVIDATTDEGRKTVEEIERSHRMPGDDAEERSRGRVVEELTEDPGMD